MKPKKIIRSRTPNVPITEVETIEDQKELNRLYVLKVREELEEIIKSDFNDINEFVDLIEVALAFADVNGFYGHNLNIAVAKKQTEKGSFGKLALNNLNPNNPSNKLYFDDHWNVPDDSLPDAKKLLWFVLKETDHPILGAFVPATSEFVEVVPTGALHIGFRASDVIAWKYFNAPNFQTTSRA
jgi:predicted house-cleaning noncanonical NTP pyrophosphatase (MazG superfamily)